jgi:hypothetical protein
MIFQNTGTLKHDMYMYVFLLEDWDKDSITEVQRIIRQKSSVAFPDVASTLRENYIILKHKDADTFFLVSNLDKADWTGRLAMTFELAERVQTHMPEERLIDVMHSVGGIIQDAYMTVTEKIIMKSKPEKDD